MKLQNISGIDYENERDIYRSRCIVYTPTDFNQKLLTDFYNDLLNKPNIKILEIGCGWGRNAQYFKNKDNIQYFSFDPSPAGLAEFKRLNLPENRFYVSLDIDQHILSQKYDLIFSTYVLQHIGESTGDTYGVEQILYTLLPCLKDDGFMFFYELTYGQNNWNHEMFEKLLQKHKCNHIRKELVILEGCDPNARHDLYLVRK